MSDDVYSLNDKINNATKWSIVTTLVKYLAAPITNIILARVLEPSIFGVVASISIIVTFADLFTDAGFSRFIIQHDFENEEELFNSADIAFSFNLSISLILFLAICINRNQLATFVGSEGYGMELAVAGLSLPISAFSCIQQAVFRREFLFKKLLLSRLIRLAIPFVITIPLSLLLRNEWALIIGIVAMNLSDAIILTIQSEWKPKLKFGGRTLALMLKFSAWSFLEAISIWFSTNIDVFIVSSSFNSYYTGLYKNSITTVGQITSLVSMAIVPVLFPALSRCQNDREHFKKVFFDFQRYTSFISIPICFGIYLFSDAVTFILLGEKWKEASDLIGLIGISSIVMLNISYFASEVYRAKGNPNVSFGVQVAYTVTIIFIFRAFTKDMDYDALCKARVLTYVLFAIEHLSVLTIKYRLEITKIISAMLRPILLSVIATVIAGMIKTYQHSWLGVIISGLSFIFVYIIGCMCFKDTRRLLFRIIKHKRISDYGMF